MKNISYIIFMGNIEVDILEDKIRIYGSRYILDKIIKDMF